MKASQDIIDFIATAEGFKGTAYIPVAGDRWTVGYGFTYTKGHPVKEGDTVTQEEALQMLENNVQAVAAQLSKKTLPLNLTQNQFDAVVSLVYNIGINKFLNSTTGKLFYVGEDISDRFQAWDLSGGKPVAGLLRRRQEEAKIYKTGDYPV